jgi:hypothetical protein
MHQLVGDDVGEIDSNREEQTIERVPDLESYFEENIQLKDCLQRLRHGNKQIFLITNSTFWYVNRGMTYLLGDNWQQLFDVVICQARKPSFFGAQTRSTMVH